MRIDETLAETRGGVWRPEPPRLSRDVHVGVMGLGQLGLDAAARLRAQGFQTRGWSRSRKTAPGVACFAGADEMGAFLDGLDVLALLLPETPETRGLVNAAALSRLAPGAHVINAARGPVLVEADLLTALERDGGLGGATLDVFDTEPPPPEHPFWAHPRVAITPHIASATRPATAAKVLLDQIDRVEGGSRPLHLVDRSAGY